MKWLLCLFYGHLIIAVGLLRGIEARAYKPKALWFCLAMGGLAIAAGFFYRLEKRLPAAVLGAFAGLVTLAYYLTVFTIKAEEDASLRVGVAILASLAQLCVVALPASRPPPAPSA